MPRAYDFEPAVERQGASLPLCWKLFQLWYGLTTCDREIERLLAQQPETINA